VTPNQIMGTLCPLCNADIVPVQINTKASRVAAWYCCPDTSCHFPPVRVALATSEGLLARLRQIWQLR